MFPFASLMCLSAPCSKSAEIVGESFRMTAKCKAVSPESFLAFTLQNCFNSHLTPLVFFLMAQSCNSIYYCKTLHIWIRFRTLPRELLPPTSAPAATKASHNSSLFSSTFLRAYARAGEKSLVWAFASMVECCIAAS